MKRVHRNKKDLITTNDLAPDKAKVRITTMIDGDVLLALKDEAEQKRIAYQTLLNQILREHCFGSKAIPINVEVLENFINDLKESMRETIHSEMTKSLALKKIEKAKTALAKRKKKRA